MIGKIIVTAVFITAVIILIYSTIVASIEELRLSRAIKHKRDDKENRKI